MAKKKNTERVIDKAVIWALHKGVSEKAVGKIVEKAIDGVASDKRDEHKAGKKRPKSVESKKTSEPIAAA
jgi:hypothetical protein